MTRDTLPADVAFTVFLGTFDPVQFSDEEWRLYQYLRLLNEPMPNARRAA